jgi:uncharacterized CHY-type Zn-finger protein
MNIQTESNHLSQFYYQCQSCHDSFICPDWQPDSDEKSSGRIALCPYCKSKHLDALNNLLPLMMH